MKSKGSAGHPDTCKECTFHFFSAAGCRNGADCCFCHEFHPRTLQKNSKKNRRIMRTLQTRESHEEIKDIEELSKPGLEVKETKEAKVETKELKAEVKAEEPKGLVCFRGAPMALTLIAGVRTCLRSLSWGMGRPKVFYASPEGQRCLEPTLAFVVQPALPTGLTLDAKTGIISGTPESTSSKADPVEPQFLCITLSLSPNWQWVNIKQPKMGDDNQQ
eukprot:Skav216551  [mRNA]  locus=scaffold1776:321440:325489:- [translate_table: standard]